MKGLPYPAACTTLKYVTCADQYLDDGLRSRLLPRQFEYGAPGVVAKSEEVEK